MSEPQPFISIISPVYGAEGIIEELVAQITTSVLKITNHFEIVLVEDHSPDHSWDEIVKVASHNKYIKAVRLSRNFGQHNAITAGMELAKGDYIVLLDCDLQHDPAYIPQMYALIQKGYDLVFTRTKTREHPRFKNFVSILYYKFIKLISGYKIEPNIGSYSMLTRKVVDAFHRYNDYKKLYLWVLNWLGFKSTILEIQHNKRYKGSSTYNLRKLFLLAINTTLLNSNKLLYLSAWMGIFTSLGAFLGILYLFYQYYAQGALLGWSSTMVIIMFFSGLILTSIGISALYIGKVFEQTKQRPRYIITEGLNIDD